MCRVLGVTRSGFYAWIHRPRSNREIEDLQLLELVRASWEASGGIYGAPRVYADLREVGETCGKNCVAKIMRIYKVRAIRGYKQPRPYHGRPELLSPNRLAQQFTVDNPDQAWVTDITYIRTWQG